MKSNLSKAVSIYVIAEALEMSPTTISRALRNRPEISAATRQKVRQYAKQIGFQLRTFESRVKNICVVIVQPQGANNPFSFYVESVLGGIWEYCNDNDLELSLYAATADRLNTCSLVRILGRRGVSGAVFINVDDSCRFFNQLNDEVFPYACVIEGPREASNWILKMESRQLAQRATEHLIQLGHKRIAILNSLDRFHVGEERNAGYEAALKAAGIPSDPDLCYHGSKVKSSHWDGFDFGASAVQHLLALPQRPTAFLAMSDEIGIAAMRQLILSGLRVPEDASVIAFDDSRFCAYSTPPLTVIQSPNHELGFHAAQIVHHRIDGSDAKNLVNAVHLNSELIIRGSTAPPPAPQVTKRKSANKR